MISCQDRSQKAGEQEKQSLYISTALRDSTVFEIVSWCLNARRRPLTIEPRAVRNLRKSSISAQSRCSNRWLTGVMQPTCSPQKRISVGTTTLCYYWLLTADQNKTGNSSDPTQGRNGITGTEDSQATCTKPSTAADAMAFHVIWSYFPHQIFKLPTREQSQVLRYNVNILRHKSYRGYLKLPCIKVCDSLLPWK